MRSTRWTLNIQKTWSQNRRASYFPAGHGEQALEIVESLVRSGKLDVIVIDSVAALTPKDEIEGDMGAFHVGKQARLMSQALRKLTAIVAKSKTIVIFINQIRMQIGVMFGNPKRLRRQSFEILHLRAVGHKENSPD